MNIARIIHFSISLKSFVALALLALLLVGCGGGTGIDPSATNILYGINGHNSHGGV